jgi:aconitate hydratase
MGVLPLTFQEGENRKTLGITGEEVIDILGLEELRARMTLEMVIHRPDGREDRAQLLCRVDTADEVEYYKNGGILHYVLRGMAKAA